MPTAMITGAGGGLGSALADALAPTHTLFLAGRPSTRLDEVATRFGATTWPIDLTDVDSIPAVVEPIVELDVLIHNAGVAFPGRVAESTVDEWRKTMAVGLKAPDAAALRPVAGCELGWAQAGIRKAGRKDLLRSEEHTSELQSRP